jgi:hypothetical protein
VTIPFKEAHSATESARRWHNSTIADGIADGIVTIADGIAGAVNTLCTSRWLDVPWWVATLTLWTVPSIVTCTGARPPLQK